jgi:hypothetical protein
MIRARRQPSSATLRVRPEAIEPRVHGPSLNASRDIAPLVGGSGCLGEVRPLRMDISPRAMRTTSRTARGHGACVPPWSGPIPASPGPRPGPPALQCRLVRSAQAMGSAADLPDLNV